MVTTMNKVKLPLIFLRDLPGHELISLNNLVNFYKIYGKDLPQDLQIFTHRSGQLDTADDTSVDDDKEIVCTTYDEFKIHWDQYRLSILL